MAALGPEPLGNTFHEAHLIAALKGRNTPIKAALLDQKIVAGLGNIYVCEALFRAGIHPARKAGRIGAQRVASLVPIIRETLQVAIAAGDPPCGIFVRPMASWGISSTALTSMAGKARPVGGMAAVASCVGSCNRADPLSTAHSVKDSLNERRDMITTWV